MRFLFGEIIMRPIHTRETIPTRYLNRLFIGVSLDGLFVFLFTTLYYKTVGLAISSILPSQTVCTYIICFYRLSLYQSSIITISQIHKYIYSIFSFERHILYSNTAGHNGVVNILYPSRLSRSDRFRNLTAFHMVYNNIIIIYILLIVRLFDPSIPSMCCAECF